MRGENGATGPWCGVRAADGTRSAWSVLRAPLYRKSHMARVRADSADLSVPELPGGGLQGGRPRAGRATAHLATSTARRSVGSTDAVHSTTETRMEDLRISRGSRTA